MKGGVGLRGGGGGGGGDPTCCYGRCLVAKLFGY